MSNNEEFKGISFDIPKHQSNVIKVIGVGGGGSNAINHMFQQGIKGVDFVICNTDSQALESSSIPNKIQLGVSLTEGLGAGANPEIGEKAALESFEEITSMFETNTKMVFITAGMGGGTGTGAAPVIAKMAKEMDILTVGIVTIPFSFEGKMRNQQAQIGIEKLRHEVDSLIVINNDKLREVYGNLGFKAGFSKADEVLSTASRGIAEVITHHYTQNIDLRDAKTVLSNSGTAIMGSAVASGAERAKKAISKALDSPLLNDNKITGAKNVLLLIVSGKEEITIDEIGEINDHIQDEAGYGANIIMGVGDDESLGDSVSVTVIATGFDTDHQHNMSNEEPKRIIHSLNEEDQKTVQELSLSPKTPQRFGNIRTTTPNSVSISDPFEKRDVIVNNNHEQTPSSLTVPSEGPLLSSSDIILNTEVHDFEILSPQDYISHEPSSSEVFNQDIDLEDIVIIDKSNTSKSTNNTLESSLSDSVFEAPLSDNHAGNSPHGTTHLNNEDSYTSKKKLIFDFDAPLEKENSSTIKKEEINPKSDILNYTSEQKSIIRHRLDENPSTRGVPSESIGHTQENNHWSGVPNIEEQEMVFETKIIEIKQSNKSEGHSKQEQEYQSPIDRPISEVLSARKSLGASRMQSLQSSELNFRGVKSIDEIEKQPAYKRAGLELEEKTDDQILSGSSLVVDSNKGIYIRKNNSFLHDNVD